MIGMKRFLLLVAAVLPVAVSASDLDIAAAEVDLAAGSERLPPGAPRVDIRDVLCVDTEEAEIDDGIQERDSQECRPHVTYNPNWPSTTVFTHTSSRKHRKCKHTRTITRKCTKRPGKPWTRMSVLPETTTSPTTVMETVWVDGMTSVSAKSSSSRVTSHMAAHTSSHTSSAHETRIWLKPKVKTRSTIVSSTFIVSSASQTPCPTKVVMSHLPGTTISVYPSPSERRTTVSVYPSQSKERTTISVTQSASEHWTTVSVTQSASEHWTTVSVTQSASEHWTTVSVTPSPSEHWTTVSVYPSQSKERTTITVTPSLSSSTMASLHSSVSSSVPPLSSMHHHSEHDSVQPSNTGYGSGSWPAETSSDQSSMTDSYPTSPAMYSTMEQSTAAGPKTTSPWGSQPYASSLPLSSVLLNSPIATQSQPAEASSIPIPATVTQPAPTGHEQQPSSPIGDTVQPSHAASGPAPQESNYSESTRSAGHQTSMHEQAVSHDASSTASTIWTTTTSTILQCTTSAGAKTVVKQCSTSLVERRVLCSTTPSMDLSTTRAGAVQSHQTALNPVPASQSVKTPPVQISSSEPKTAASTTWTVASSASPAQPTQYSPIPYKGEAVALASTALGSLVAVAALFILL